MTGQEETLRLVQTSIIGRGYRRQAVRSNLSQTASAPANKKTRPRPPPPAGTLENSFCVESRSRLLDLLPDHRCQRRVQAQTSRGLIRSRCRRSLIGTFVCSGTKFVPSCAGLGAMTSLVPIRFLYPSGSSATAASRVCRASSLDTRLCFQPERTMTFISVIVGSTRQGRFSEKPAQWIFQQLKNRGGVDARLLDLRDFPMPLLRPAHAACHAGSPGLRE